MNGEIFDKGGKKYGKRKTKKNKQEHPNCCVFSKVLKMLKLNKNFAAYASAYSDV